LIFDITVSEGTALQPDIEIRITRIIIIIIIIW